MFKGEPKLHPGYLALENVVLLPHLGSATVSTRDAMGFLALDGASAAPTGADFAAAAIALGHPGTLDPRAAAYLEEQTRLSKHQSKLSELQSQNLIDQNAFELSHLRFRRFSDYARFGLELAGFLVVLLVVCGLGSMVWNAIRDRGLVVDAFSVPPDLAQTGMTGSIVANRLIDKLGQLQAASFAVVQGGETYRRDASGGARVEIPDTGISLDELQRYLRDWLGHETHATGEVVRTAKGWSGQCALATSRVPRSTAPILTR